LALDETRKLVKLDVPARLWTEQDGKWRKITKVEATQEIVRQAPTKVQGGEPKRILSIGLKVRFRQLRAVALGTDSKEWETQKLVDADTPVWRGKRDLDYVSDDLVQEWIAELVDIIRQKVRSGDEEVYRLLAFYHELDVLVLPDGGRIELPVPGEPVIIHWPAWAALLPEVATA
jgi:hypothetical protein